LSGGLLDAGLVDVADHQFGTLAGERERGLAANTAPRAGERNQCVTEGFARPSELRPKQLPARRPTVEVIDEFDEGLRQDVRMRHRHPVARLDVAPP
jgi:hypothetical protein